MSKKALEIDKRRDRQAEDSVSKDRFIGELVRLREKRDAGALGVQMTQIAQAMVLCGLPYSPTKETKIVRRARLGTVLRCQWLLARVLMVSRCRMDQIAHCCIG